MAVPLIIRVNDKWSQVWLNFSDHLDVLCEHLWDDSQRDEYTIQELNKYHAWTNMYNWSDPLWFPDEETRAAFVLAWS